MPAETKTRKLEIFSLRAVRAGGCTGPAGTGMVWAGTPATDARKTRTPRIQFREGMIDYRLTGT